MRRKLVALAYETNTINLDYEGNLGIASWIAKETWELPQVRAVLRTDSGSTPEAGSLQRGSRGGPRGGRDLFIIVPRSRRRARRDSGWPPTAHLPSPFRRACCAAPSQHALHERAERPLASSIVLTLVGLRARWQQQCQFGFGTHDPRADAILFSLVASGLQSS